MHISTKGRYGLRALLDLAVNSQGGPIALSAIAKRQQISEGYLEQIMMPMRKHGLVKSIRGAKGGYLLARPPHEIMAGEVFEILEGDLLLSDCIGKNKRPCSFEESCSARILWKEIEDSINKILFSYSLEDLLQSGSKNKPE